MPGLALIIALLLHFDPVGHYWVSQYPVRVESPIIRDGVQYHGWGNWIPDYIAIDLPGIGDMTWGIGDRIAIAMCILPHEAMHVRKQSAHEELPLLAEYVCLDRAGASWGLKDAVYGQLKAAVIPPFRPEE